MKRENTEFLKSKYLISSYEETRSADTAVEICEMVINGHIRLTAAPAKDRLVFLVSSKYAGKCSRCDIHYEYGAPIFLKDKKAWHLACCTNEELDNTYVKTCVNKGLIYQDIIDDIRDKNDRDIEAKSKVAATQPNIRNKTINATEIN